MSWSRYLFHDWFTAAEFNRIEERMHRQRRADSRAKANQLDRLQDMEDEIARLTLLTHALAETCVASGAITREKLREMVHNVDAQDGRIDGKMRGRQESQRPPTTHEFLSDLEDQDRR